MIDPAVTAKALATSEAHTTSLMARAERLAGKPEEESARVLIEASQRITNNLRAIHETNERRSQ